ncbi:unnamed protein product [Fraxinus pennsylvanica]|uniref:La-related protein 6B n=1 Tax=Fraxinus pennsylvanica TaxID=56036 RepID=A0AAD2E382_9LAMI|nr:unnamed protein product [Fraxinus pennsylvanica]
MDQQDYETLGSSENNQLSLASISSKLNAKAPEFVPRSASVPSHSQSLSPPPSPPVVQRVYMRPPFVSRQVAVQNYYQNGVMPFYGYLHPSKELVNGIQTPAASAEMADVNTAGATVSIKNGMPDAQQKILSQVEFYFSDINLATTDHLFGFMIKDPDGYVPLSVVASFKKIKNVISGVSQLSSILRSSKKLVVSEDGKKVRRQHPLTDSDMEELQSHIVIAENLPEDHCHQNLMKIFSSVGSVKSIRTCLPQNFDGEASSSSPRTAKVNAVHFRNKLHAFVEYESVKLAEKAVVELNDEGNWRNSLKVRLLIKNAVKSAQVRAKKVHDGQSNGEIDEAVVLEGKRFKEKHLEDPLQQLNAQPYEYQWEDNANNNSHRKAHNFVTSNGSGKGKGRGRPQHHQINGGSLLGSPELDASIYAEKLTIAKASPVPRMPDGTKGFSMGRGKPLHAFVEYESVKLAEKAVVELNDEGNWRNSLKVRLLIKNVVKSAQVRAQKVHDGQSNGEIDEAVVPEGQRFKEKHLEDPLQQLKAQPYEYQWEDNANNNSHTKAHNFITSNGSGKGKGRGRPQHHQINGGSLLGSPEFYAEKLTIAKASPVPRMPDGTKGFSMGRGKPVAISTA